MTFDETVVSCAAPTLCGIKPANLFSMKQELFNDSYPKIRKWNNELGLLGKKIVLIKRCGAANLFFIYDEEKLWQILKQKKHIAYLAMKGYHVRKGKNAILRELFSRLARDVSFPHEIGLFLGYPLEDVVGFESENKCKYAGAWAVYGNVASAQKKMRMYKECSTLCCRLLNNGMNIPDISKNYSILKEVG